ncbi:antiterminator Q family protein [Pseudomonas nitroreducens]|uniref:antiterminator Q family protein n=1 Tax=Pseudomonas nitroreducens TaxID=46680 RepID=UPI003D27693B
MKIERSTESLLEQWGIWVRQGTGNLSCAVPSWSLPTARLTDDEGLELDGLVARLGQRHPLLGEAVLRYYTTGKTYKQVGTLMGVGEEKARQAVKAGVVWVDGALEMKRTRPAA